MSAHNTVESRLRLDELTREKEVEAIRRDGWRLNLVVPMHVPQPARLRYPR